MKVIGKISDSRYICEVSHDELEKYLGLYFGKMTKILVGEVVDLGAGYNYHGQIKKICDSMEESIRYYKSNQDTLLAFVKLMKELPDENSV